MKSGAAEAVRSVTVLVTEELVDRFADGDTVVNAFSCHRLRSAVC
jgi:hypothetical protein